MRHKQGCQPGSFKVKNIKKSSLSKKLEAKQAKNLVFTINVAKTVETENLFDMFDLAQNGRTRPRPERGRNHITKGAKRLDQADI